MDSLEMTDYSVWLHRETAKAILVSEEGDRDEAFWIPKSQMQTSDDLGAIGTKITISLPDWLAREKGLG